MNKYREKSETLLTEDFSSYQGLISSSGLPLAIVSPEGSFLQELIPVPDFCKCICLRSTPGVPPECLEDLQSTKCMCRQHRCVHGLSSFVVPILCNGVPVMYLTGGNAYAGENVHPAYMRDISALAQRVGMDPELIAKMLSLLQVVSQDKLAAHMQLGKHIANSLSQKLCGDQPLERSTDFGEQESKGRTIQIKTDFLFNMLNCIARTAYFERAEQAETMIYQLSDLLRFYTQTGPTSHTVQKEVDYIEKYLYLQKARFQDRLKYSIDIPEHIRRCHILNSVLQPLVDNALLHGIMLRRTGGEICLRAKSRQDCLTFLIIDNGNGFSKETLHRLRSSDLSGRRESSLIKIHRRLRHYYGEPYGLEIVKSDAEGSTVSVMIPRNPLKR